MNFPLAVLGALTRADRECGGRPGVLTITPLQLRGLELWIRILGKRGGARWYYRFEHELDLEANLMWDEERHALLAAAGYYVATYREVTHAICQHGRICQVGQLSHQCDWWYLGAVRA